jgi:hypothetical protein
VTDDADRGTAAGVLAALLDPLSAVSLQVLDERAPLLRRVDHTYVVAWESFVELIGRLGA